MDLFKPLGKRDIFGIILPGTIVVFAVAYLLFGVLVVLQLPVAGLLSQQFLLSIAFFVSAYLVGNLLRMFAADDADEESSKYLETEWRKKHPDKAKGLNMVAYNQCWAALAKGEDVSDIPDGFDDWLWRVERFPYPAGQSRKWQAHNFREPLDFFREHYKASMWSENQTDPKNFFHYCKLYVINGGGELADEVNMEESFIRFFAGTWVAFRISIWLLRIAWGIQLLFACVLILVSTWGITVPFPAQWTFQGFYLVLTPALDFSVNQMRRLIVKRFRRIRRRETETVYYAFYIHSISKTTQGG